MEAQQVASKIAQLESRVATLEDEGKIVKGEVKQILTEIRSAILVRDNPFDADSAFGSKPTQISVVRSSEPVAKTIDDNGSLPAPKVSPTLPVCSRPPTARRPSSIS